MNPFASVALDTVNLEAIKSWGKISFVFKKQGFGKDFKTDTELLAAINELYNTTDTAFALNIKELTLSKLEEDNTYTTITTLKNLISGSVFYAYGHDVCFDGPKDFCSLTKDMDPMFVL